jgi:hypothetical protein
LNAKKPKGDHLMLRKLGAAFMANMAAENERKAEAHRVRAGKTFHSTKGNLRKAERLERNAAKIRERQAER